MIWQLSFILSPKKVESNKRKTSDANFWPHVCAQGDHTYTHMHTSYAHTKILGKKIHGRKKAILVLVPDRMKLGQCPLRPSLAHCHWSCDVIAMVTEEVKELGQRILCLPSCPNGRDRSRVQCVPKWCPLALCGVCYALRIFPFRHAFFAWDRPTHQEM